MGPSVHVDRTPQRLSNREIEDRAIAFVLAHERVAGRRAEDTRRDPDSEVDVESVDAMGEKWRIEVKAFGGTGRGEDLWLEPNQVEALSESPGSHLYLVINVNSSDPAEMRILDLTGEQLRERLEAKREKHHFEVPMPVADYDALRNSAMAPPTVTGT